MKKYKMGVQRRPGRPRKYILPVNAYSAVVYKYQHPSGIGRPPRKIVNVHGRKGLVCIECNKPKPVTEFWFARSDKLYLESVCRTCKRKYSRDRHRKNKK